MTVTINAQNTKWEKVLASLESKIERHVYDGFFSETKLVELNGDEIVIFSPSAPMLNQFLNYQPTYKDILSSIISSVFAKNYQIKIVGDTTTTTSTTTTINTNNNNYQYFANCKINPRYTFENFVTGECNKEAMKASLMVATSPSALYNPLFIYSKAGLGKTHLLHAIGNYYQEKNPGAKVLYITTDAFIDEFVKYVHGHQDTQSLKEFFNTVDLLLVDDIQFLADKEKTSEHFFYIFNALVNNGKQIILTSDRHPKDIRGLEDRLVSRFNMGLSVQIFKPDTETLLNILKRKIILQGLEVKNYDENGLLFLAETFSRNVRELEGALNRLLFHTVSLGGDEKVTFEDIKEAVRIILPKSDKNSNVLTEELIIKEVSEYYNISQEQILSKVRTAQIALARRIAMYLCRFLIGSSYPKIGEIFDRDHSTVITGVEKVENELKTDNQLIKAISDLKKRLKK